jgi:2,3-bisphosphoglycerate-dependent phosphoglycerate mutase
MAVEIVYETHALTEDNERGIATGWLPGRLSARVRELAAAMGRRRLHDRIAAVFASDLRRSVETAEIAFGGTDIPILYDGVPLEDLVAGFTWRPEGWEYRLG